MIRYVKEQRIEGDIVECGVWRGGSAGLMALANLRYGTGRRRIHLFDAWGDWPDPTPEDGNLFEQLERGTLAKADNRVAYEHSRELLEEVVGYPADQIVYHRGLFESTVPAAREDPTKIARGWVWDRSVWRAPSGVCTPTSGSSEPTARTIGS